VIHCFADTFLGDADDVRDCMTETTARLKSRVSTLEAALVEADRMRQAVGDFGRGESSVPLFEEAKAYDQARERTRK
jgi:hypothetical protein